MSENIRSTNLRFNLEKDTQKRAWQYLQNMDKQTEQLGLRAFVWNIERTV